MSRTRAMTLSARLLVRRAWKQLRAGRADDAQATMSEAAASAPGAAGVAIQQGLLMLDDGQPERALTKLEEAADLEPSNVCVDLFRGIALLDLGDLVQARAALRKVVHKQRDNLLARGFLAVVTLREGRPALALRILQKAGLEASHRLTGRLLTELEKQHLRLRPRTSNPLPPSSTLPLQDQGESLAHTAHGRLETPPPAGNCAEPLAPVTEVDQASTTAGAPDAPPPKAPGFLAREVFAPLLLARGERALFRNDLPTARRDIEAALSRHPKLPRAHYLLGVALLQEQRGDEAYQALQEALKLDGPTPDVLYALGCCLLERGELEAARERLEQMLRSFSKDAAAEYTLGQIAVEQGDDRHARDHFERAAALDFLVVRERLARFAEVVAGTNGFSYNCPGSTSTEEQDA